MKEALSLLVASVRILPGRPRTVKHNGRSQNIGLYKHLRVLDAPVHMALRRKVNHPVDFVFLENFGDGFLVADIRFDKGIILPLLHLFQIFQIPRIGQCVHVDDADLVVILFKHVMNIVGTDKSGSPGH